MTSWSAHGAPLPTDLGGNVTAIAFSLDGGLLAVGDETCDVQLWNPETGQRVGRALTGFDQPIGHVAFNNDGSLVVAVPSDDFTALPQAWDVATQFAANWPQVPDEAPDAQASSADEHDWDALSDYELETFSSTVVAMTVSTRGEVLTASTPSGVDAWEGQIWLGKRTLHADFECLGDAAFAPGGALLATSGPRGSIRLWDTTTGHRIAEWAHGDERPVRGIVFSRDAQRAVFSCGDEVLIWNLISTPSVLAAGVAVGNLAFSPDGMLIAACRQDGGIQIWDATTGQPAGEPLTADLECTQCLAFSPNGRLLATGGGPAVQVWVADRPAAAG